MFTTTTLAEVTAFIKKQQAAGHYKASAAKNLVAAVALIQDVVTPEENSVGYVKDHVDDLFERYQNLNPKVGHQSIIAYRSRLSRAVRDYVAHRTGTPTTTRQRTRKSVPKPQNDAATASATPAEVLRHRFPLRVGFDAEVLLPRDFSVRDARRMTQWINTLAFEELGHDE